MFEPGSRYYSLPIATWTRRDGREITYVRRRFLPQGERMPTLVEVRLTDGDRLDLIAGRTLGAPEHFWPTCDAQNAMDPNELETVPGRTLRIPVPRAGV